MVENQEKIEKKDRPVKVFKSGLLEVAIWKQVKTQDDKEIEYHTYSFSRAYKDGEDWKKTQSLRNSDMLVLAELIRKAYGYVNILEKE